jgi:hypothetical protein
MIERKDFDNVRTIMYKAKKLADNEKEKENFEKLIKGFNEAAIRYLNEVPKCQNITIP